MRRAGPDARRGQRSRNEKGEGRQTMSSTTNGGQPAYYIPQPSHWPITGAAALLMMGMGAAFWFNGYGAGPWVVLLGFATLVFMMVGWFGKVIGESESRIYSKKVDISF